MHLLPRGVALVMAVLVVLGCGRFAFAQCGDGVTQGGEDCDDGGVCLGGMNAGTACSAEADCLGNGICIGGTRAHYGCASDAGCPDGACRHCVPQGGDGCAANCTSERDVPFDFILGEAPEDNPPVLTPHTSGVILDRGFVSIPEPFLGTCDGKNNVIGNCYPNDDCGRGGTCTQFPGETLTIGKPRDGKIPVVIKADSVHIPAIKTIPGGGTGCWCFRGVRTKTCGGVFFEADGITDASNCTPTLTAGDSVCTGKAPCTFIHGEGNTASGEIGCDGLDNINVTFAQDSGGASAVAGPPVITVSGVGGPGSASLLYSLGVSVAFGACYSLDPSVGPDHIYCTADDSTGGFAYMGTSPAVTGTATAVVHNADMTDGEYGPVSVSGVPFSCTALEQGNAAGAGLVQAFDLLHLEVLGDLVVSAQYFAAGTPGTPTPTPTAIAPCIGDCDSTGEVTVGELIVMVNIVLGSAEASACRDGVVEGTVIDVAVIVQAVNHALSGCAG
jgi:hypothetical protein